jgi:ABC-2 type transport system permease protein
MKNKNLILLKTMLDSTSQWNAYKYGSDKKKKGKIIGNTIGVALLYMMLMSYCILTCIGYGKLGLTGVIPSICALTISMLALVFTFFKTNGYLFNFKEYDMLMSLPFKPKTVAGCKFLYMYVKTLPWYLSISVSMLIGYAIYADITVFTVIIWLLMALLVPVIPMLAASFLGYIIARISAGFKKNNIVQTVLTFLLVIFAFSLRFIIESVFRDDRVEEALETLADSVNGITDLYIPAKWFTKAVTDTDILSFLLLTVTTIVLFEVLFILVGRSYREINSKLKNHAASGDFKMSGSKQRSILNAIAFKELRRIMGSSICMIQLFMGELLALLIGILVLFIDFDDLISTVTQGAPVTSAMLHPSISLIVYFLIGMVSSTAATPSLEGKNYWIVKSLPIPEKTLYQGKMLFNMYLTVPVAVFTTAAICISAKTPLLMSLLSVVLSVMLCAFSTAWGCVCGVKHIKLEWENEIEVVKQGTAITLYLLPNMIATMVLIVLSVFLGMKLNGNLVVIILIFIVTLLTFMSYRKVVKLCR